MSLTERLTELVSACFTGLWIESHEHEDALAEMARMCQAEKWRLAVWDLEQGLRIGAEGDSVGTADSDPLAAIRALPGLATKNGTAILVLVNFHRFLQSAEIVQALARQMTLGKPNRTFVVILSPVVQIPVELEKQFIVVEHELPGREQLHEIACGIANEPGELPTGANLSRVLDAAAGLTRYEAEGAFSLSIARHGQLQVETLWEQKSQMLKKSGLMQLHRGSESFADLGGLESLKAFCQRALLNSGKKNPRARAKGILLLSPPGCGKSQFCKALGNETGRPTLILDIGSLLGSLVGQSEANIRQALRMMDAMAPAIAFLDECEKAFSGVSGSQGDSGVSARLFGTFLSYLNDHETDVYIVATANDVSKLPPEFSRAERFDGLFFVDLPDVKQRQAIWQIYLIQFGLDPSQKLPEDDQWTGAEIKACCRLSALLDVPLTAAAQNVVPVARTSAESVSKLRQWASGRCLCADRTGIYQANADGSGTRRRVARRTTNPENN